MNNLEAITVYCGGVEQYSAPGLRTWQKRIKNRLQAHLQMSVTTVSSVEYGPDWSVGEPSTELIIGRMQYVITRSDIVVIPFSMPLTSSVINEIMIAVTLKKMIVGWGLPPVQSLTNDPHDLFWLRHCADITTDWGVLAHKIRGYILNVQQSKALTDSLRSHLERYKETFLQSDSYALQLR